MPETATTRTLTIDPVTRIEGHGKVSIVLDEDHHVLEARLHIVEFRGFERFIQGRPYWELPVVVQRLCGICPVSHHLCAAKAVDLLAGVDSLTPTGEKMRRLMHHGQVFQSHALHFFHLASPDLLFGFDAPADRRNVFEVLARHPELGRQGIAMRRWGQEIIRATAGKRVHGDGAVPGGINKSLSIRERDALLAEYDAMLARAREAVAIARDYTLTHLDTIASFGSYPSNHASLVADDGAMDLYDGRLRVVAPDGGVVLDGVEPRDYAHHLAEEVRPWSYMKFPYLRELGPRDGWFRVGPLARINVCERIPTPEAEAARVAFVEATGPGPCPVTLAYHWCRTIEALHAVEVVGELLRDPDLQSDDRLAPRGELRPEAVAMIEAPRGTLTHHYRVDRHGQVDSANLIVSTTCNNEAMQRAVARIAEDHLDGRAEITEPMLNHVEVGIRAFDPCLSCATHALGRMPLEVEVVDHAGAVLARRMRP